MVQRLPTQRESTSGPPSTWGPGSAWIFFWISRPNPSEYEKPTWILRPAAGSGSATGAPGGEGGGEDRRPLRGVVRVGLVGAAEACEVVDDPRRGVAQELPGQVVRVV